VVDRCIRFCPSTKLVKEEEKKKKEEYVKLSSDRAGSRDSKRSPSFPFLDPTGGDHSSIFQTRPALNS
jgi:hypothetical protein